jgi:hypothetical protein
MARSIVVLNRVHDSWTALGDTLRTTEEQDLSSFVRFSFRPEFAPWFLFLFGFISHSSESRLARGLMLLYSRVTGSSLGRNIDSPDACYVLGLPTFHRILLPPTSVLKSKSSKQTKKRDRLHDVTS